MMVATDRRGSDPFAAFSERFAEPRGTGIGPLGGARVAVKDMIDVAGAHVGMGLGGEARLAIRNAPIVTHLIERGARIVGMTAMTALAYEPSGANAIQGRPRNPWNEARICGGSSSGSAVAVAAGLADFALGSDTGGSLRIPAHCCGVSAWKPSYGLLPVAGTMPLAPSLDTIGFLAPSAIDLEKVARTLLPESDHAGIARVAHLADLTEAAAPAIGEALANAIQAMRQCSTVVNETGQAVLDAADGPVMTLLQGEAARAHAERIEAGSLDPVLARRLAKGRDISDADLAAAREDLARQRDVLLSTLLQSADALLLPVMPLETPLVSACEPTSPDFSARTLYALSAYTRFVNGLGLPAVALPVGFDAHAMPIAAQIVGRPGSDLELLRFAAEIQACLYPNGFPRPPAEGDAT